jgi:hypothetical protein
MNLSRDFQSIYVINSIIESCLVLLISIGKLNVFFLASFFSQVSKARKTHE